MADEDPERDGEGAYISVTQAVKLIPRPSEGNPKQLREFIEVAEAAIAVTHPGKRELLLKFIVAKIQGDAKDKLLAKVGSDTWPQIRGILEENYLVNRTLEYYTGTLLNSRQGPTETVAQWGARLDTLAMDLGREVSRRLSVLEEREHSHYVEGGLKLVGEFLFFILHYLYNLSSSWIISTCYDRLLEELNKCLSWRAHSNEYAQYVLN
jgi:hypothetical protein